MKNINILLTNILLPFTWMALTGSFTLVNFVLGFILSSICMWLTSSPTEVPLVVYVVKCYRFALFMGFFVIELLMANLRVAWEVITPKDHMRPAIIAIPLDAETDLQITVLANFITLTPGTLTLDVSQDRKTLYVHAMYVTDPDHFRINIKARLERRVMEVF